MTQKVSWFLKDRIILGQVWGKTVDATKDLAEYDKAMNDLLNESQASQVHLIFDARRADGMPSLKEMRAFTFPKHPRFKVTLIMRSTNTFLNFIASAISQMTGSRAVFVNSIDDAIQYLQELELDMPDLTPYRALLETTEIEELDN